MNRTVKIVLWANLAVLAVLTFIYPHLMISPGTVIEGHHAFYTDCFACHTAFSGATPEKCIACHKPADIGLRTSKGALVTAPKTKVPFHQKLLGQDCVACHSDHEGVIKYRVQQRFSHTQLDTATRDQCVSCHRKPSDKLHQPLSDKCSQCHAVDQWKPATFKHELLTAAERTDCVACHRAKTPSDQLHKSVSDKCGLCHSTDNWKPATFKHETLPARELADCVSCHRSKTPSDDLHRNASDKCGSCHTTDKWRPATFDHAKLFVLDDYHRRCTTCHRDTSYRTYTCYFCHEHTPEAVREKHVEEGVRDFANCVACHRSADEDQAKRAWESMRRGIPYRFDTPWDLQLQKGGGTKKHD